MMQQNLFSYYTKNYRWCQSILPLFFIGIGCAIIWNNQYPTARIITIILMGLISISGFVDTYKKYKNYSYLIVHGRQVIWNIIDIIDTGARINNIRWWIIIAEYDKKEFHSEIIYNNNIIIHRSKQKKISILIDPTKEERYYILWK